MPKKFTPMGISEEERAELGPDDCGRREFVNQGPASTSAIPSIYISNVLVAEVEKNSMLLPISILSKKNKERTVETKALLDTGAGGKFIDQNFVLANCIRTQKLEKPITIYNVDGTKNKTGTIT